MGNYASIADVSARFENTAALLFVTNSVETGTVDESKISEAIDGAEGDIDSYLGRLYLVPISTSDVTRLRWLKEITTDLAEIRLLRNNNAVPQDKTDRENRIYEMLTQISMGDAVIPGADTPASSTTHEPTMDWNSGDADTTRHRRFTRDEQGCM